MVSRKSKARALFGEARRRAAEQVEAAVDKIDEKADGKASEVIQSGGELGKAAIEKTNEATRSGVERGAGTETGAKALAGLKTTIGVVAQAPILSAVNDTVQARQGTSRLVELVQEHPFDPMPAVWLAEAMLRAGREQGRVNVARTAFNPLRAPIQVAAKAVSTANEDVPRVPAVTQLLGRAYVLSLARLEEEVTAHELHALSRVYLARGAPDEAVRLANGAIAVGGDETALAAVTLARAHGRRRAIGLARQAAELAVASGSTVGNQILAELPDTDTDTDTDTDIETGGPGVAALSTDERAALLAEVRPDDVARYRGAAPGAADVVGDVLGRQRDRFTTQGSQLKAAFDARRKGHGDG